MHMSAFFCHAMVRVKSRESSLGSALNTYVKPSSNDIIKRSVKEMSAFNQAILKDIKIGKISMSISEGCNFLKYNRFSVKPL